MLSDIFYQLSHMFTHVMFITCPVQSFTNKLKKGGNTSSVLIVLKMQSINQVLSYLHTTL